MQKLTEKIECEPLKTWRRQDVYEEYSWESGLERLENNQRKLIDWLQQIFAIMTNETAKECPNCKNSGSFYVVKRQCECCGYQANFPFKKLKGGR